MSYFISIFYINTVVLLSREQKEEIAIKMLKEGHSHNFWNLLHKFVPDYNDRIKWLELNSKNILQS